MSDIQNPSESDDVSYRFHQALKAAVVSGAKLDLGTTVSESSPATSGARGGFATLAQIDRLQPLLEERILARRTNSDEADSSVGLPGAYVSAFRLYERTQRIDLVLDSLSLRRSIDESLARLIRPVWVYLAFLVAVATAGMALFANFTLPRLVSIRNDMRLAPAVAVTEGWTAGATPTVVLIVLPILMVGLIILALSTKASARFVTFLGGARYRATRMQAMKSSLESAALSTSPSVISSGRAARLSFIAENRMLLASDQLMRMRVGVPTMILVFLGGSGVLLYGLAVFAPLIVLIRDMATLAADQGVWP